MNVPGECCRTVTDLTLSHLNTVGSACLFEVFNIKCRTEFHDLVLIDKEVSLVDLFYHKEDLSGLINPNML